MASVEPDLRKAALKGGIKKSAAHTDAKRLPWLDGRDSRAANTTPAKRLATDSSFSSPLMGHFSHKPPVPNAFRYVNTPTAAALAKQRIPSPTGSSPSPAARHRLSQARRASTVQQVLSPLRRPLAHRPAVTQEPQQYLSVVQRQSSTPDEDDLDDTRPRLGSLAPVPDHLQWTDTSDSMLQRGVVSKTSPEIVSRVHVSPSQPAPNRTAFERIGSRRIGDAIESLEDMVQEAIELADDIAGRRQIQGMYPAIDKAWAAMQHTSADPASHNMATISTFPTSESSEVATNTRLKTTGYHNEIQGDSTTSFDWAYPSTHRRQRSISSSVSSCEMKDLQHATYGTQSDLLLPPQPIQATSRDHVDFVLRPIARHQSRGRARHRFNGDSTTSSRSRRRWHHRSPSYSSSGSSFGGEHMMTKPIHEKHHRHIFSLHRRHRRQPIARNWRKCKKRWTAMIACINTALLGIIVGIYAGEVPRIQYYLADESHRVVMGNAVLYFGLALSTFIVWPLPLLHGRKRYILAALALALPLQFPQALVISQRRSPNYTKFRAGLLTARALTGLVLGFANVNYITVLLDLFGASLQSKNPHQEHVIPNDVRRHGGGMGIWLGIWSWCWIASIAVGFQIGAAIIGSVSPDWGFYVIIFILVGALFLNIIAPETRRKASRKSVTEVYDRDENFITRRVVRGECKLHLSTEGPVYWFEEVWAGMKLMVMMMCQAGFFVLSFYLGWIYAQITLVIILLGALLSKDYRWQPRYVGAGVISIAIGALLAVPLTKARIFSRERKTAFRTDSMTFQKQVTWSSHLVRRTLFMLALPVMGLVYTFGSAGRPHPWAVPVVFAGALGFFSVLAIAECHGLIMETFDTCDLQPGVNTRHRLESMAVEDRRRRTNYTSFPRVSAGIFASQTIAFVLAGIATLVGGSMTRRLGAQKSTGATAGILLGLTILLTVVLWRLKQVQVMPNHTFTGRRDTAAWTAFKDLEKEGKGPDWKAVVIGNPSGKMRKMNILELGSLSRWTEVRKLNHLIKGRRLGEDGKQKPTLKF